MRMLGKRFVRQNLNKVVKDRRELRDAILWEVHPELRLAYVRVQGSNENIVAFYPRHWTVLPYFMKIGTSVRIVHVGGVNKFEISGQGLTIPTPVTGSSLPPIVIAGDGVLAGLSEYSTTPPSYTVLVEEGQYRIDGVIYTITDQGVTMGEDLDMGGEIVWTMGEIAGAVTFDDPPVSNFRYDAVVVGSDGVFDYLKGTEAANNPVKPAVPSDHVLVGSYVLMYGGMTEITEVDIGREWTTRKLANITLTFQDDDLSWVPGTTEPTQKTSWIGVQPKDQYGANFTIAYPPGFYLTLEIIAGNGTIYSAEEGSSTTKVGQHAASGYNFNYARDTDYYNNVSPTFLAQVEYGGITYSIVGHIILRDEFGEEMI